MPGSDSTAQVAARLGVALQRARRRARLTQSQVAAAAGISVGGLRDIEQGRTRAPRQRSIEALAAALGTTFDELTGVEPTPAAVTIRLLGPLSVAVDGVDATPAGRHQRALLGVLALHAGRPVSRLRLESLLWPSEPPDNVATLLQSQIGRLRRRLSGNSARPSAVRIISTPDAYRLVAAPGVVDASRFLDRGRAPGDDSSGATDPEAILQSLRLWRGAAVADLPELHDDPTVRRLEQRRREAVLQLAEAVMHLRPPNRSALIDALAQVEDLASVDPLDEAVAICRVRMLVAADRVQQAHDAYRQTCGAVRNTLGLEPTRQMITSYTDALVARASVPQEQGELPPPAQLPRDVSDFVGRAEEAEYMVEALQAGGSVSVSGHGGLGKTTLAIHVAHRVREEFPDGQLFVDLQPTDGEVLDAASIAGRLLSIVRPDAPSNDDPIGTLRSVTTHGSYLMLLDNAHDAAQVKDLLPAGTRSSCIVTSRRALTGLDAVPTVRLDVLSRGESERLLRGTLDLRADAESSLRSIVDACGHLPLALRLVAETLAAGLLTCGQLARQLADEHRRLDVLRMGDRAVRASIGTSWASLSNEARRAMSQLSMIPSCEFAVDAARAVLFADGHDEMEAEAVLGALCEVSLISIRPGARMRMHDLVRAVAREHASEVDPQQTLTALADFYVPRYSGVAALAFPYRVGPSVTINRPQPSNDGWREVIVSSASAREWAAAELPATADLVRECHRAGLDAAVWQLADLVAAFARDSGEVDLSLELCELGLSAARRTGRYDAQALLNEGVARSLSARGDNEAAERSFSVTIDSAQTLPWPELQAAALENRGISRQLLGDIDGALDDFEAGLSLSVTTSQTYYEAACLNDLGTIALVQGRLSDAESYFRHALELNEQLGDRSGRLVNLSNLAFAAYTAGRLPDALEAYREVLTVAEADADTVTMCQTYIIVSRLHSDLGERTDFEHASLAVELAARSFDVTLLARALAACAVADAVDGRTQDALLQMDHAMITAERSGSPWAVLEVLLAHDLPAFVDAAPDLAEAAAARAAPIAQSLGDPVAEAKCALLSARAARQLGRINDARTAAARAESMFLSLGHGRGAEAAHEILDLPVSAPAHHLRVVRNP